MNDEELDRIGTSLDIFTQKIKNVPLSSANECHLVQPKVPNGTQVVPIWKTLGISRRTYFRHKKSDKYGSIQS